MTEQGASYTLADRPHLTPYAKAAAYMGLALVTPASGWVCYKAGQFIDREMHTEYAALVGLMIGCAVGLYETYREGLRIEGLSSLVPKPPKPGAPKDEPSKPE